MDLELSWKTTGAQGLPQALQGSQFSAIIGLAKIINLQDEVWDFEIPLFRARTELKSAVGG